MLGVIVTAYAARPGERKRGEQKRRAADAVTRATAAGGGVSGASPSAAVEAVAPPDRAGTVHRTDGVGGPGAIVGPPGRDPLRRKGRATGRARARIVSAVAAAATFVALLGPATAQENPVGRSREQAETAKIRITVAGGRSVIAALAPNATARDFASLLPLSLTLKDYASTEKVSDLPKRLSTQGAPDGFDPAIGDVAYYAPWGNLAIFYKDFGYSPGLVRLGVLEGGVEAFTASDPVSITIERAE